MWVIRVFVHTTSFSLPLTVLWIEDYKQIIIIVVIIIIVFIIVFIIPVVIIIIIIIDLDIAITGRWGC